LEFKNERADGLKRPHPLLIRPKSAGGSEEKKRVKGRFGDLPIGRNGLIMDDLSGLASRGRVEIRCIDLDDIGIDVTPDVPLWDPRKGFILGISAWSRYSKFSVWNPTMRLLIILLLICSATNPIGLVKGSPIFFAKKLVNKKLSILKGLFRTS